MNDDENSTDRLQLKPKSEVKPGLVVYYENEEDDGGWIEELLEDDEVSDSEAAFMYGYMLAENDGFEQ